MRRRGNKLQISAITKLQDRSRGYILITLMLFLSLLAIAALAVLPDVVNQIKRDHEEELIHRGLGYARGVRRYYKKFGRYPTRIEELENTNTLRFIRKRYKDPVTNQDFRILRMGDIQLGNGMMLGQGPGARPGALGGGQAGGNLGSKPTQPTNQQTQATKTDAASDSGTDSGDSNTPVESTGSSSGSESGAGTAQVFGGGPMLGVVSASKGKTIREFCNKSHYKDWFFVYDPTSDRGGTLNSPWCPGLGIPGVGGTLPQPPAGTPSTPNTGAPGTVAPTLNQQTNPGADMPPEQ